MKKILSLLTLFLVLSVPVFSEESIFVPDITIDVAKNAMLSYIVSNTDWSFSDETDHSLNFYKEERVHDNEKYEKEKLINKQLYESKLEEAEKNQNGFAKKWLALTGYSSPQYYNSTITRGLNFVFIENNGVTITTNTSSQEISDIFEIVFTGYYDYNLEYKIPLFKKDYITISDTPKTLYANYYRLGNNKKVTKINDKKVSDYNKSDLRILFEECTKEKLKLEVSDGYDTKEYYILRTYTEPTYKQYL